MKLKLSTKAGRQLKKIRHNADLVQRLRAGFLEIASNPYAGKPLDGVYEGMRSWRVGDWRIIYRIYKQQLLVLIIEVANRKEVYR
ncbi:type II toxin-antitoxin system RelE/ParE family toxin [bacterium]|nr:type II toxin-antitoxin system RelE/ParE family toxin [bacterium]